MGLILAIDFDGTVCTHDYPSVGKDIGAVPVLEKIIESGTKIILFTMRSGNELEDAVEWYEEHNIPLYGINVNPDQHKWTSSPKCYAQLYIDDAAIGVPLKYDPEISNRPFVDWNMVEQWLKLNGIIE